MKYLLMMVVAVVACGGGEAQQPWIVPDARVCPPITCGPSTCGSTIDECGNRTDCLLCRYQSETVSSEPVKTPITIANTSPLQVAYNQTIATKGTPWASAPVDVPGQVEDFAVAPDGTPWVLALEMSKLAVAYHATTWTSFALSPSVGAASLAIDAAGKPYVAFLGVNPLTFVNGLFIASFDGTAWNYQLVEARLGLVRTPLKLVIASNEPWVAWQDMEKSDLVLTHPDGAGGWIHEVADDDWNNEYRSLDLAVDAQGDPHVAYQLQNGTARLVAHATRHAGVWTREFVAHDVDRGGDTHIAIGPNGEVAIVFLYKNGAALTLEDDGRWFVQRIGFCGYLGDETADARFDANGTLGIVHSCTLLADGPRYLTLAGLYPEGYRDACESVANAVCTAACGCGVDCCIQDAGCIRPLDHCVDAVMGYACGDPSQDPAVVYSCGAAIGGLACSGNEAVVPAGCSQF